MEGIGRVVISSVVGGLFGATTFFGVEALTAKPANASIYAVEQKDGNWKVSKYDDNDPKLSITSRDMRKTIDIRKSRQVADKSTRILTAKGKEKQASHKQDYEEWKLAPSPKMKGFTNAAYFCGMSGNCNWPRPGTKGSPAKPVLVVGTDFTYGKKEEKYTVQKPNPNYLKQKEPTISFTERARNPGGLWLIGTTKTMSSNEFWKYLRYLEQD